MPRRRCNFCHYESDAFAFWSSKDHADKNRGGRDRPRSCLPPHTGTTKAFDDDYLVRQKVLGGPYLLEHYYVHVPGELRVSCAVFLFADICQTKDTKFDRVGECLIRWHLGQPGAHHLRQLSVLSVTILNISSGIGRCCTGFFADRIGPTNTTFAVVLISGLAQLLVWNFVSDYPGIVSTFEKS